MERARRLMHGPEYHAAKSEIMAPIDEFLRKVDARTGDEVVQLRRRGQRLNIVAITGLGTTVVLVLVSFILVARQRAPALFHVILARQLAGVGLDGWRRLDQALAFEEGGEAGVAGVVERGRAQREARQRVGEGAPVQLVVQLGAALDEQREALLRMVHQILDARLHGVEKARRGGDRRARALFARKISSS